MTDPDYTLIHQDRGAGFTHHADDDCVKTKPDNLTRNNVTACPSCSSLTHTLADGSCGKCGAEKPA
jgi:hypothetical protein